MRVICRSCNDLVRISSLSSKKKGSANRWSFALSLRGELTDSLTFLWLTANHFLRHTTRLPREGKYSGQKKKNYAILARAKHIFFFEFHAPYKMDWKGKHVLTHIRPARNCLCLQMKTRRRKDWLGIKLRDWEQWVINLEIPVLVRSLKSSNVELS